MVNAPRPTHPATAPTDASREHGPANPEGQLFNGLLRAGSLGAALAGSDPRDHTTDDVIAAIRTAAGTPRTTVEPHRSDPTPHHESTSAGRDTDTVEVWELVQRAQAGESEAFGLIYDRYVDTVFRYVYFRVGNRPLAEDITSDTFLRALRRIGGFTRHSHDLGTWLVTIARNLIADHLGPGHHHRPGIIPEKKPTLDIPDKTTSDDAQ
ncbi:sigma factor [Micromonospora sp. LOL_023]